MGVMVQDSNSKILVNNPAAERLLGLSSDQMRGKTSFDKDWNVIHEDGTDFPGETHPVPVCIRTGKPVVDVIMGVYRPNTRDRVWLLVNAKPELDTDNKIKQVICTFQDMTKSRTNERLLQEKEERLRLAFLAGNQGLFDLDLKTGKAKVNSSYAQMLGFDLEDFEESNLNWKTGCTQMIGMQPIRFILIMCKASEKTIMLNLDNEQKMVFGNGFCRRVELQNGIPTVSLQGCLGLIQILLKRNISSFCKLLAIMF